MDGTLSLRERGTKTEKTHRNALPVYSTDTEEEGKILISTVAALYYDGRMVVRGFLEQAEENGIDAIAKLAAQMKVLDEIPKGVSDEH